MIERLVQNAAYELGVDPAELRRKNFIPKESFPYRSVTGFEYDSGLPRGAWTSPWRRSVRRPPQGAGRGPQEEGRLLGIGLASFTEVVGAGRTTTTTSSGSR